jgi:hypothetical protein
MVLPILDFRILASRVRVRALVLVRACARPRACRHAGVGVGVGVGERVHGGGRVCLRFDSVINMPLNEQKGRF